MTGARILRQSEVCLLPGVKESRVAIAPTWRGTVMPPEAGEVDVDPTNKTLDPHYGF